MAQLLPPILYTPQFSRDETQELCEISSGVLKGIIDRKHVTLQSEHNPGTGRRRLYTGGDCLKIRVADVASSIGFPQRWSYLLADQVMRRAVGRLTGTSLEPCKHYALAFYPNKAGDDWAFVPIFDGKEAQPLPIARQVIDVDRLIDEMLAKLQAIVADEPVPSFATPQPKAQSPDWRGMYEWSDDAKTVLMGLDRAETEEFFRLQALWVEDRSQPEEGEREVIFTKEHRKRQDFLDQKYESRHDKSGA